MFSHTLFSLPFALLTMFIAANGLPNNKIIIFGIIALVAARTGANAFNRYADRFVDAINPRTANRHIPSGILKGSEALFVTILSYVIYFYAAYNINELCFYLAVVPIIIFTIYPYTKRFTFLCHLVLGFACSLAVLGAWIAVTNNLFYLSFSKVTNQFTFKMNIIPFVICIAVMLWNAGFDIIYGTQDIEHDKTHHIYSIPQTFGLKIALLIAKVFHFLMIVLLFSLTSFTKFSYLYNIGVSISAVLLLFEHKIVKPHNPVLMKLASYKLNQIISITIFIFACLDIFLQGGIL